MLITNWLQILDILIMLWIFAAIGCSQLILITIYLSDQSIQYRILTIIICFYTILLSIPHFFYILDHYLTFYIFDVAIHLSIGITIFMVRTNIKYINKKYRKWISFIITIISIFIILGFESILNILTPYLIITTGRIFRDILWVTLGGLIALIFFYSQENQIKFRRIHFKF